MILHQQNIYHVIYHVKFPTNKYKWTPANYSIICRIMVATRQYDWGAEVGWWDPLDGPQHSFNFVLKRIQSLILNDNMND